MTSKYRYIVSCSLKEIPHLSEAEKQRMIESYPPHQRQARVDGLPVLGSGSVFYVPEDNYVIKPIEIFPHWRRVFSLDVGQHTAVLWGAIDPNTGIMYIYDELECFMVEPPMVVHKIKSRPCGKWIRGVVDPSALQGSKRGDGDSLYREYSRLGLKLTTKVDNGVETGITRVINLMLAGRLKIFNTCQSLLAEIRMYYRNDKGLIANKQKDHLVDNLRYITGTGYKVAKSINDIERDYEESTGANYNYYQRNEVTGY